MRTFISMPIVAILIGAAPAAAQGAGGGLKAGVNVANLDVEEGAIVGLDRRVGLVAGAFVSLPLAGGLGVQPEILYSQKGATFDEQGATGAIELDFLEVPILARYAPAGAGGLVIFGGPSLGFKLRARSVIEFGDEREEDDLGEDVESFEFGVVAGAGLEFGRFTVDGRYTWGLTNLNAVEDEDEGVIKNRVFAVLAGYRF